MILSNLQWTKIYQIHFSDHLYFLFRLNEYFYYLKKRDGNVNNIDHNEREPGGKWELKGGEGWGTKTTESWGQGLETMVVQELGEGEEEEKGKQRASSRLAYGSRESLLMQPAIPCVCLEAFLLGDPISHQVDNECNCTKSSYIQHIQIYKCVICNNDLKRQSYSKALHYDIFA